MGSRVDYENSVHDSYSVYVTDRLGCQVDFIHKMLLKR